MPRVRLVDGDYFTCGFTTTAAAWRGRPGASLAYETACKAVVHHVVRTVAAKCDSGEVDDGDFFPEVRRIMAAEAALKQEAATQVLPIVKKEAPKSRAAMRQAILKMEPQDDVARVEELEEKKKINERGANRLRLQTQIGVVTISIPSEPDPLLEDMDITLAWYP